MRNSKKALQTFIENVFEGADWEKAYGIPS